MISNSPRSQVLQDGVEGFESSIARRVIEAELGPISEIFDEMDDAPAAAASLAQVYRR